MSPVWVLLLIHFWVVNPSRCFLCLYTSTHCFISLDCCLLLSICVIFRCVLHPLPLPLSSCLGCIPPLIGLPSLRFYAVGSSLFLLSVCFCLCSLFYRDDVLCWLLLARPFLYAFHAHLRFPVDLVWFRLSCDHGWIRSGSVNVRKQQQQQPHSFISSDCCLLLSISVYISLCVASVALALVFMLGLYPTAYRATLPCVFLCGCL